jgi:hypothetical protein
LRVLKPIGLDAAVKAVNALIQTTSAAQRQLELALQKATFDVAGTTASTSSRRSAGWRV